MSKFRCHKCGECCRDIGGDRSVFLTRGDIEDIAASLQIGTDKFLTDYTSERVIKAGDEAVTLRRLHDIDGKCVFLDENELCRINQTKPLQCAAVPERIFAASFAIYECAKGVNFTGNPDLKEQYLRGILQGGLYGRGS